MPPDVWLQLSDAPGGLTDSRGGVNGASPPASQKDALLSSQPNKPSPPSSPSSRGQAEVSKVSESVQEELSPPPQKAAPQEQSRPEPPKKKKDPVGENGHAQLFIISISVLTSHCPDHTLHPCPFLTRSEFSVSVGHLACVRLIHYQSHRVGLAHKHYSLALAMTRCLRDFLNEGELVRKIL